MDTLATLTRLLGDDRVFTDPASLALYASDETPQRCTPLAVCFPRSHDDCVSLVRWANQHHIALIPRGAGSGNVGGALPRSGSVVVSFECMQRVLEFDPDNRLIRVETGIITDEVNAIARTAGLMYAPDPGSGAYCRIGGNLAMNAAGPRAVKYGATRDHVLGLRAVTGDGREITTGSRTSKYATGYDLTRLLVGSEGTLALITEATLKLVPAPAAVATLRLCYHSNHSACAAVARVMRQPVIPCALEFMDRRSIECLHAYGFADDLAPGTQAILMVEADGDDLPNQIAALTRALEGEGQLEIRSGIEAADIKDLWSARKSLSSAVKQIAPRKINEDVVVPVAQLADLVDRIDRLATQWRVPLVVFGHAGNGNLHVNIMVHADDADEMRRATACRLGLVEAVLELGGSLSGEHGIGSEKRHFIPLEIDAATLGLMRQIKASFDPAGILNPGKKLPD
ncbi:MAG: FAD-binding protein [Betaproteobacteria bacterium]|nr:MAG: FAD-binding protein [Betaproteobacteria bacterium]